MRLSVALGAAVSLASTFTAAGADPIECSFNGRRTGAGLCRCRPPWSGPRCNSLPVAPHRRTPAMYAALGERQPWVTAQCSGDDCTAELNAALASPAGSTVLIPRLADGRPWSVRGVDFASSDIRVVVEAGVTVQALKNSTYLFACDPIADLAVMHRTHNLSLAGYGATLRMWREDYVARCAHSEFRMALAIQRGSDITIAGLTISHAGGDGLIVMGDGGKDGVDATSGLTLQDMVLDRNYRQGISVISVVGMRVTNVTLSNTNGTSPAHGVDFEPDTPNQRLSDIVFSNCTSVGNQGSGFGFDFAGLTSTHWAAGLPPVTISFEDCDAIGNHAGWTLTTAYPGLPGSVEVVRGTTSGSLSHGIGIYNKAASAVGVSFRDHQVRNVSTGGSGCTDVDAAKLCPDGKPVNAPVALFIRDGTPEKEGGVNLSNLSVADSRDRPWLQVIGDSNGWSDVSLDWVSVTNPHGCVADLSHVYGTHPVPAHQTPVSGLADVHCIKADDDEADDRTSDHGTHLRFMSFLDGYTMNATANADWITLNNGADYQQMNEFASRGVRSLLHEVPAWQVDDKPHPSRGQANRTHDLLPDWEATVERWAKEVALPFMENGTVSGVYIGDELCSHNIYPCWKLGMDPLTKKLRQLLGRKAILYTNECESSFGNHTTALDKISPDLDYISFDLYAGLTAGDNASTEVDLVRNYFESTLSKMMYPHQKLLLVPGLFGCTNVMSLAESSAKAVEKLDAYFQWAKADPRIAGFAGWHWGNRHSPQYKRGLCNMEVGASSMPDVVAKLREMGRWIKSHQRRPARRIPAKADDSDAALVDALHRVVFRNSGLTLRSHEYDWEVVTPVSGKRGYLELENVSRVQGSWGGSPVPQRFLRAPARDTAACTAAANSTGFDIPGHDLSTVQSGISDSRDCARVCCATARCDGFVFLPAAPSKNGACDANLPCCFLKVGAATTRPVRSSQHGIIAVNMHSSSPAARGSVPPSGIRSSVPLGGISTGSTELRGDGSFAEWTIQNQSPAGAAKVAIYPHALLALRLCGQRKCAARLLQTHPKGAAAGLPALPAIDALAYSGTFPVSRLQPIDSELDNAAPGLNATLFAFSSMVVGDVSASARPSIAFVATLRNTGHDHANASLMINMPLQTDVDHARPGVALGPATQMPDSQSCAQQCQKNDACQSWNFRGKSCQLQSSVGLNRYTRGTDSGVRGYWAVDADGRCVTLTRPGDAPTSGHVSLCASSGAGAHARAHSRLDSVLTSFGTGATLGPSDAAGQEGAVMLSVAVPPRSNRSISLTMGWRFPNRDWYNYDCDGQPGWSATTCGGRAAEEATESSGGQSYAYINRYAELYPSARGAAWASSADNITTAQHLLSTVDSIEAVHSVFTHSSLPEWLQDHLLNSVSHVRDAYIFSNASCPLCTRSADPRVSSLLWRQFEAFDCTDLDSIHNDGERHIPYLMIWPDTERSKLAAWANNQAPPGFGEKVEGMLAEQIHQNTPDTPDGWTANTTGSGRHMGDSSSAFVLEVLELYRLGNDLKTVSLYYETVKGVVKWQLTSSAKLGVPFKLETSYDLLGFPRFDIATYNSVFHIATLAAAAELADAMDDVPFAASCRAEQAAAAAALDTLQWNESEAAYMAGSSNCNKGVGCKTGSGIFADSFYAQVLSYTAGIGTLVAKPSRLLAHLSAQLKRNCIHFDCSNNSKPGCPNGLVAVAPAGEDFCLGDARCAWRTSSAAAVWEMPPANHATLGLHLGLPLDQMLAVFEGSATSYSRHINDQWNVAGLKDTAGNPIVTSHYGMHLVAWHIPLAISGQQANLPNGTLSFAPKLKAPYSLPVVLPGVFGSLSSPSTGRYALHLTVGALTLTSLSVDGNTAPGPVHLTADSGPVQWTAGFGHRTTRSRHAAKLDDDSVAAVVDNATAVLAAGGCPCQNASLCKPITRTGPEKVYAFTIGSISYCVDCPGFKPRTTWRDYDWSQITTIGWQNWHSPKWPLHTLEPELLCHAHAMDVRVTLMPPPTVWGNPANWSDKSFVENATRFMAAAVTSVFADGFDIDIEKDTQGDDEQVYKHALTALVSDAVSTMHAANPHSHVTMATPSEGSGENACGVMYGRIYDWAALSRLVDLFLVMDYDSMQLRDALPSYVHYLPHPVAMVYKNRSAAASACAAAGYALCHKEQLEGLSTCHAGWTADWAGYWFDRPNVTGCTDNRAGGFVQYPAGPGLPAGAWCCGVKPPCPTCFFTNAALTVIQTGVDCYESLGVAASKLVLLMPWYGYDYTCRENDTPETGCHVVGNPTAIAYSTAASRQQRALPPGRMWQKNTSTPHFYYLDNKTLHRVDYDDSQSLRLKYKLARTLGAAGVGMWTASAIRYNLTDDDGVDEGVVFWEDLRVFTRGRDSGHTAKLDDDSGDVSSAPSNDGLKAARDALAVAEAELREAQAKVQRLRAILHDAERREDRHNSPTLSATSSAGPPPPVSNGVRYVHKKTYATSDPLAAATFAVDYLGASGPGSNRHKCGNIHSISFPGTGTALSGGADLEMHFVYNPHKPPGAVYMNATDLGLYEEHLRGTSFRNNSMDQFIDNHIGLVVPSLDPYVRKWQAAEIPFVCRTWCCAAPMPQFVEGKCPAYSFNRTGGCETGCYVEVPHGLIMELQCGLNSFEESLGCLTVVKPDTFDLCSSKY